ncbi:hypothetical protein NPIL_703871 [Nephila pilipes]|uniref:Uncharacterized protein n=1 Tax=Nephila pilipes TaxID=299642 RepID=A0A8X6MUU7_NEPPI|nr:hypothetical protein NPIL_703871 [Nephila pilipes]
MSPAFEEVTWWKVSGDQEGMHHPGFLYRLLVTDAGGHPLLESLALGNSGGRASSTCFYLTFSSKTKPPVQLTDGVCCPLILDFEVFRWSFIITVVSQPIIGADFRSNYGLLVDIRGECLVDSLTKWQTQRTV